MYLSFSHPLRLLPIPPTFPVQKKWDIKISQSRHGEQEEDKRHIVNALYKYISGSWNGRGREMEVIGGS